MPELVDIDGNIEWQHRETGDRLAGIASDGTIIIPSSSSPSLSVSGEARIAFDGTGLNVSLGGGSYATVAVSGGTVTFSTLTTTGNANVQGNLDVDGTLNVDGTTTLVGDVDATSAAIEADTLQAGPDISGVALGTGGALCASIVIGDNTNGSWVLFVDGGGNLVADDGSVTRTLASP